MVSTEVLELLVREIAHFKSAEASPHLVGTQIMVIINWLQPKLSQAMIIARVAQS